MASTGEPEHSESTLCEKQSDSDELDADDIVDPRLASATLPPAPTPPARGTRQSYESAMVYALGAVGLPEEQQRKKIMLAQIADLEPVACLDAKVNEYNLLATSDVMSDLLLCQGQNDALRFYAVEASKPASDNHVHSIPASPSAYYTIATKKWKAVLGNQSYVQVNNDIARLLNTDWTRQPWLQYFCSRITEGMLLIDGYRGLLVHCAEVYCRLPSIDPHHEKQTFKKSQSLRSSLPSDGTIYPNVEVTTLKSDDHVDKLVIGTKVVNYLITSSIRIDVDEVPTIGASSCNGFTPSKQTQIFLVQPLVEELLDWAKKQTTSCMTKQQHLLYPFDELAQLRQVRLKFYRLSTYLCCRSSSSYANDLRTRPVTIWTLEDHGLTSNDLDTDGKIASKLFKHIAVSVLDSGNKATLSPAFTTDLRTRSSPKGKMRRQLDGILSLFADTTMPINIIGNKELDKYLVRMADNLSPYLNKANAQVAATINKRFDDLA